MREDDIQKTPTGNVMPRVNTNTAPSTGVEPDYNAEIKRDNYFAPAEKYLATPIPGENSNAQKAEQNANTAQKPDEPAKTENAAQNDSDNVSQGGLSADEQAMMDIQQAAADGYRRQYRQASDITQGVYDYLNGGQDNEERPYKKKNESKKKILALADALRNIGNLFYVSKGAVPQKFNNPVLEQEQKYQNEKALRDKDRAARSKYAMDKAKMDADAAYKDAMLNMKQNEFTRNIYNDNRKYGMDRDKFNFQKQKTAAELDLKGKTLSEAIRSHKANEALRGESNSIARQRLAISRQRLALAWAKENGLTSGQGSLGKGSMVYVTPEGVTYTLSKKFLEQGNIKTIYDKMQAKGLLKYDKTEDIGGLGTKTPSKATMLSRIMGAATSSKGGHNMFVYYAKRLGYRYEGGMDDSLARQLGVPRDASQPTAPPKTTTAAPAPKQTKKEAPKQPAKPKETKKKNNRSNLSI